MNMNKNFIPSDQFPQRKWKRKYIRSEAERACAKEAAASRQALEALQKELASAPQVNSFVIEESCTETTVENFIPHTDDAYIDNLNELQGMQVVNYAHLNGEEYSAPSQLVNVGKSFLQNPLLQYDIRNAHNSVGQEEATDKIKHILGSDLPGNVEIMFKTSDGNFVSVTDEVLQNITKGALQYQVIDENGHAGEIQELRVLDKVILDEAHNEDYLPGISNVKNFPSMNLKVLPEVTIGNTMAHGNCDGKKDVTEASGDGTTDDIEGRLRQEEECTSTPQISEVDAAIATSSEETFDNKNATLADVPPLDEFSGISSNEERDIMNPMISLTRLVEENKFRFEVPETGTLPGNFLAISDENCAESSKEEIAEEKFIPDKRIKLCFGEKADFDDIYTGTNYAAGQVNEFSPRKTRSNLKCKASDIVRQSSEFPGSCETNSELKREKIRKLISMRKRK